MAPVAHNRRSASSRGRGRRAAFHDGAYWGDLRIRDEIFWDTIRTIRVMRHRDRQGSGNILGRIAHPKTSRSGAALSARRNSSTVPANGSTGGANPLLLRFRAFHCGSISLYIQRRGMIRVFSSHCFRHFSTIIFLC